MSSQPMRLAVGDALRELAGAFPGTKARPGDLLDAYAKALDGLDPVALPHAVTICMQRYEWFPKAKQLRDAVLEVMRRYSDQHGSQMVQPGAVYWSGRPDEPCPTCGAWAPITEQVCERSRCRHTPTPHTHHSYEAPPCSCCWPSAALRPFGSLNRVEAAYCLEFRARQRRLLASPELVEV